MPAAVLLPSERTTSLTTSALILLARIRRAAMPTVSFIRIVTTRAFFLRRTSPTCMATSSGAAVVFSSRVTLVYIIPDVNRIFFHSLKWVLAQRKEGAPKCALTLLAIEDGETLRVYSAA